MFPVDHTTAVFTPEGLQPLDGIKVLPLDPSVAQGTTIADATIADATIAAQIAAGNDVVYWSALTPKQRPTSSLGRVGARSPDGDGLPRFGLRGRGG